MRTCVNETKALAVLSGGVGGAKLVLGFANILHAGQFFVIANTADDFIHFGLHIAPDIDSIIYSLAGLSDDRRGWGRRNETWNFMGALNKLKGETWFNLGDTDLAMHVERTRQLSAGHSLTEVTSNISSILNVKVPILPMTDDTVSTIVHTESGKLSFQHYFVKEKCKPKAIGICFDGINKARPNSCIVGRLERKRIDGIIIAPSNPFVSIDPILAVPNLRSALCNVTGPIIDVSPIVGGRAIKGPADKMMAELGMPASATAVAEYYLDFIDAIVIDEVDSDQRKTIESMGLEVLVTQTVMNSLEDKKNLALDCLEFIENISASR